MNHVPKVSVIVPNYNHSRYLRERLDSVYGQKFKDFEVILLDDASTDNSLEILGEYAQRPNTRMFVNEKNSGSPFKQWNKGVRLAEGEFVWIAESDDVAAPAFLQKAMEMLEQHPKCGLFFCRSQLIYKDGINGDVSSVDMGERLARRAWIMRGKQFVCKHMMRLNTITNASSVVFKRSIYGDAGMAPEDWLFCGDWLLWCRLCSLTYVSYNPNCLNYHRIHEGGLTTSPKNKECRMIEYYRVKQELFSVFNPSWWLRQQSLLQVFNNLKGECNLVWSEGPPILQELVCASFIVRVKYLFYKIIVRVISRLKKYENLTS